MNEDLKVFLYGDGVSWEDVTSKCLRGGSMFVLYVGMWNLFSTIGGKEFLYLQIVLKMNSCTEVPVSIIVVLY